MKSIPAIKTVMTPFPYWVERDASLGQAISLMREHDIRHLPVKDHGKVYSVITERDINIQLKWHQEQGRDVSALKVDDVSVRKAYTVSIDEPLDNVLVHMAEHHCGSVVVVKGDRLAGVFTSNDACRCYGEFLRYHFRPGGGDDAA
ncbi:MAG: CBS domain-containing protein [Gammaproteobacteria bacterium]|nr:CBS domain-containing protein [Gammaproteobacteria bacterium]